MESRKHAHLSPCLVNAASHQGYIVEAGLRNSGGKDLIFRVDG